MRKNNLFITPIFIFIIILTIISLIFVFSIDYFIFDRVLNSSLCLIYPFIIIFGYLVQRSKLYKFAPIILIVIITLLFWINKPNFTYRQAVKKIQDETNLEYIHKDISNIKMFDSPTIYIDKEYVINMKKDGQVIKYVFNPINGKYDILD